MVRRRLTLERSLQGGSFHFWLDTTYEKVGRDRRIVSVAAIAQRARP